MRSIINEEGITKIFPYNGGDLGEILEIKQYENIPESPTDTLGAPTIKLRKASNKVTGNNEFVEYLCKYFGLRKKYSQELLLNYISADLSEYSTDDLKIFEQFAVPVSGNEVITNSGYFGSITVNERLIIPFIASKNIKFIVAADNEGDKMGVVLDEDVDDEYDKIVFIIVAPKKPKEKLVIAFPIQSLSTSFEPERLLKERYIRNDEKFKSISALEKKGTFVFDALTGNIIGTDEINSIFTPILNRKLSIREWNPYETYSQGDSVTWKGEEWISLAPRNNSKDCPKISPLWDKNPITTLNKRVRIEYSPSEIKEISPDKYITVDREKTIEFRVTVFDGYTIDKSCITPEIEEESVEQSGNKFFFTIRVTDLLTNIVINTKSLEYFGCVNKTKQGDVIKTLEEPIIATLDETDPNNKKLVFNLSSIPNRLGTITRNDGVTIDETSGGIYVDSNIESNEKYYYTLNLESIYYVVHVVQGDELFELDKVYERVLRNDSITINFYPLVSISAGKTVKANRVNKVWNAETEEWEWENISGGEFTLLENNGIYSLTITPEEDANISITISDQ